MQTTLTNIEKLVVTVPRAIEGTYLKPGDIIEVVPADLSQPLAGVYLISFNGVEHQDLYKVSKIKGTNKRFYCTVNNKGNIFTITPSDIKEAYKATAIISSPVI